jgi:hypothetical protein
MVIPPIPAPLGAKWIAVWLALSAASIDHMVSWMRGAAEVWRV